MLDIKLIKEKTDFYKEKLKQKNFNNFDQIDAMIKFYNSFLSSLLEEEKLRSKLNEISSSKPSKENMEIAKQISAKLKIINEKTESLKAKYLEILYLIPNLPFSIVPLGKGEDDNVVVFEKYNEMKKNGFNHYDILDKSKKLIFKNESINMSGSRHVIFGHELSLLMMALEKFMIDQHISKGYELFELPVIVNDSALFNTGQLPKFEEDLFKLTNNQFLIPTSEVTLTNLFSKQTLKIEQLPLKVTSLSNCFRSEAGSAGKDTRGLIRLHQFRKVELVKIGNSVNWEEDLNGMLDDAKAILDLLEIPYRVIRLCTGDMSFSSAITYDIEVWLPGQKKYREISSVSCMSDFQSRRMNIKVEDSGEKKSFAYTYNGSALAIERTLAAIIENYYDDVNKIIKIPKVLLKYLPFSTIKIV